MDTIDTPRPEHPRPQFRRDDWVNLNGVWTFAFDPGKSGHERGLQGSNGFGENITVPFCPESKLSGVEYTDFIEAMWYHRRIEVPESFRGKRVLLHFGGVDYLSEVYIDGHFVGRHWGGAVGFTHEISRFVSSGATHDLVVWVHDDVRSGVQPGGKQRSEFDFRRLRASYTRTTGIWQTVWMEAVDEASLESVQIVPDIHTGSFLLIPRLRGGGESLSFRGRVVDEAGTTVSTAQVPARAGGPCRLEIPDARLWSPADPWLYELELEVVDGSEHVRDHVRSYAGLRETHLRGDQVYLNGEPLYQRLVLDQGYYPDGIWTAPSDEALRNDIELSMRAGFNGARLHQKVFEERFHYWADRLGYLTWGEFPSWGMRTTEPVSARNFLSEWARAVERDRNHPSIIAWSPLNETREIQADPPQHNRLHIDAYDLTKALDPTRPVNDASGYIHVKTDLWTIHDYNQNPAGFASDIAPDDGVGVMRRYPEWEVDYEGQPYLVAEFGGILWIPPASSSYSEDSWGYGEGPKTEAEFYERLEGLVDAILSNKRICGYCYTQLTDVEQEQNGVYTYDRRVKLDMDRIAAIFRKTPQSRQTVEAHR